MGCIKNWHETVETVETVVVQEINQISQSVSTVPTVSLQKISPFITPEFDSGTPKSLVILIYS